MEHRWLLEVSLANAYNWPADGVHRGTIDLREVVRLVENPQEVYDWEYNTWVVMRQGSRFFVHMHYDYVLKRWREATNEQA